MNAQQISNTLLLRTVIQNKIDAKEPEEYLDQWAQPCGTKGCVLGDYVLLRKPEFTGSVIDVPVECERMIFEDEFGFYQHFGSFKQDFSVIGTSNTGTLQERLDYVESKLKENGVAF